MKKITIALLLSTTLLTLSAEAIASPTDFVKSIVTNESPVELIDFDTITKTAIGVHWDSMSVDQRAQIQDLLSTLVSRSVARHLDEVQSYPVVYDSEKTVKGKSVVALHTQPVDRYDEPVRVEFHLSKTSTTYTVQDVVVEDVSMTKSYRDQFNRIIVKSGVGALIEKLKKKVSCPATGPTC